VNQGRTHRHPGNIKRSGCCCCRNWLHIRYQFLHIKATSRTGYLVVGSTANCQLSIPQRLWHCHPPGPRHNERQSKQVVLFVVGVAGRFSIRFWWVCPVLGTHGFLHFPTVAAVDRCIAVQKMPTCCQIGRERFERATVLSDFPQTNNSFTATLELCRSLSAKYIRLSSDLHGRLVIPSLANQLRARFTRFSAVNPFQRHSAGLAVVSSLPGKYPSWYSAA